MVAAKLATYTHGGDRSKPSIGGLQISEASQSLKVGQRSVQRAEKVLDNGTPETKEVDERGELPVSAAAARQRLHRQRQREGRWVLQIETWPDLVDALEIAGFGPAAGIETREDVAAAITAALLRWESNLDRLRPAGTPVTRDGHGDETVVNTPNRRTDDHDADNDL